MMLYIRSRHFNNRKTSVYHTPLALAAKEALAANKVADPGDGTLRIDGTTYSTNLPAGHNLRRKFGGFRKQPCDVEIF